MCPPMIVEILSAIRNADIPKNATGDLAPTGAPNRPEMLPFRSPGESTRRKAPELRGFFLETGHCPNSGTAWLGREDSNLRMAESKSAALLLRTSPRATLGRAFNPGVAPCASRHTSNGFGEEWT